MKKLATLVIIILIGTVVVLIASKNQAPIEKPNQTQNMLLTSPSFNHNEKIPSKFTCDGGNINPELHILNVPAKAKSLALIMDDPDAVGGRTFTHWLIWNIDPKTEIVKQESVPPGAREGQNDAGKIGYLGPCPPDKKPHRYFFKLYALNDSFVETESIRDRATLESIINGLLIEKAELIGIYERQQI